MSEFTRLLAIDICTRGLGFVVLEDHTQLVDWGVHVAPAAEAEPVLDVLRRLLSLYQPDTVVTEDFTAPDCRKSSLTQALLAQCCAIATHAGCSVNRCTTEQVRAHFQAKNKYEVAQQLAAAFPPLARQLPPKRKIWMSEDYRIAIFDALAFAHAAYRRNDLSK